MTVIARKSKSFVIPNIDLIEKKWIPALRSGRYPQVKHTLRDDNGFCCLGVACDIVGARWKRGGENLSPEIWMIEENGKTSRWSTLPYGPREKLGFATHAGISLAPGKVMGDYIGRSRKWGKTMGVDDQWPTREIIDLTLLNDSGMKFKGIADILQRVCDDWKAWIAQTKETVVTTTS